VCFACRTAASRLNLALARVLPISLCPVPSPLYGVLLGYKEAPIDEVRRRHAVIVDALFTQFLTRHEPCLFGLLKGPPSVVLPVPSSSRPGPSPLDHIDGLGQRVVAALERPSDGPTLWCPEVLQRAEIPVGHMAAHAGAFKVPEWAAPVVAKSRVLLLDDTYVSGARSQSAAAALRLAGASDVLIVPIGRIIRPATIAEHAELLRRSRRSRAGAHRCGRCVLSQRETGSQSE
jgi:hypothetical protein